MHEPIGGIALEAIETWNRRDPGPRPGLRHDSLAPLLEDPLVETGETVRLRLSAETTRMTLAPRRARRSEAPATLHDLAAVMASDERRPATAILPALAIGPLAEEACGDCAGGWRTCPVSVPCPETAQRTRGVNETCPECLGVSGDAPCVRCLRSGRVDCTACLGRGRDVEGRPCETCRSGRSVCPVCDGRGTMSGGCRRCRGRGEVRNEIVEVVTCEVCEGSGRRTCPDCAGEGRLRCPSCGGDGAFAAWRTGRPARSRAVVLSVPVTAAGPEIEVVGDGEPEAAGPLADRDALARALEPHAAAVGGPAAIGRLLAAADSVLAPAHAPDEVVAVRLTLVAERFPTVRVVAGLPGGGPLALEAWRTTAGLRWRTRSGRPPEDPSAGAAQSARDRRVAAAGVVAGAAALALSAALALLAPVLLLLPGALLLAVALASLVAPRRWPGHPLADLPRSVAAGLPLLGAAAAARLASLGRWSPAGARVPAGIGDAAVAAPEPPASGSPGDGTTDAVA